MTAERTDRTAIQRMYDEQAEREYMRLERDVLHEAEFALTVDLLEEYVQPGSHVLDVGAGPGRYAEWLIRNKQARVGLVDISAESLRLFEQRVDESAQAAVLFSRQSDATDLGWVEPETFDVVLLMGPLYHLVSEHERAAALEGSCRALKPGGLIVAAFISLYQSIVDALGRLKEDPGSVRQLLEDGQTSHLGMQQWRCWPSEAQLLMEAAGFRVFRTRNLEGAGIMLPTSELPLDVDDKEAWLDALRLTCENSEMLGATWHFVCLGRRE